ncbi:hypothetical protein Dda_7633 [Drechslerella dactyloides]|uniref:LIM zinc-binding domain-containing protein n=1 Tax=Drechslerella dactyloides TaxID=74499 RepID=A0AAD6NGX9_DREDA|nr:hypothetical protein Dda_7633 [Drechslerella dactyloides]
MERVRPSFMTKEQLDKYMSDVKQNRAPRPRPNFELPAKRLSLTLNEQLGNGADQGQTRPAPLAQIQSDMSPAFRRFGGSVRDVQRSKGTFKTRNGWIVGDASAKPTLFGRKSAAESSLPADSRVVSKPEKANERPVIVTGEKAAKDEDKENRATVASRSPTKSSPVDSSLEDSITQLQKDISDEIEAVSILLDSPVAEHTFNPTAEDVEDESEQPAEDTKADSPAPLKISRTLPVDIKPSKVLHSSQRPEAPIRVTSINTVHYQVNAPPTPSSTPPEPERRPKFEDRGVPTFTPATPPTPPNKVMVVEDNKIVGEIELGEKDDAGYNLQQGKNPHAVIPSAEVSRIASRISELQLKADPNAPAPKPAFPSMTMEEFKERNESPVTPTGAASPLSDPKLSQFTFSRTNSLPPTMPSFDRDPAPKKPIDQPQYKPYRPPTQPQPIPHSINHASPAFLRARAGSNSVVMPPTCPSPAPGSNFSGPGPQAVPSHMKSTHSRHSSLGNLYQYGQQPPNHGARPAYGFSQQRQSLSMQQPLQNPFQVARGFQTGPPPLPAHGFYQQAVPRNPLNPPFHRSVPSAPVNSLAVGIHHSPSIAGHQGRALPALPRTPAAPLGLPKPPSPTTGRLNEQSQESPRRSPPTVGASPAKSQSPVIPSFSFDHVDDAGSRQLPSAPRRGTLPSKPTAPVIDRSQNDAKPLPPVPVFSFSDDSSPSPRSINPPDDNSTKPTIPILNLPDDDANNDDNNDKKSLPPVPTFSVSGPEEPASRRPLPTPAAQKQDSRPLPSPSGKLSGNSLADRRAAFETHSYHAKSLIPKSIASCTACGNHISARAVSASGLKFHPECFRCSHCSTRLEHVAFYPEPLGPDAPEGAGPTGRFFCHLDFHELFSPRCKSCKTPIEGEVVEACGATWHAGHFFCAECGDPFDAQSRFVEKDKYAWCLPCYQKRYSSKCKKCKKPVTDTVVKALDAHWHMECFCCFECGSEFQDGRYFLREGCKNEPVCTKCEETRLKSWELVQ